MREKYSRTCLREWQKSGPGKVSHLSRTPTFPGCPLIRTGVWGVFSDCPFKNAFPHSSGSDCTYQYSPLKYSKIAGPCHLEIFFFLSVFTALLYYSCNVLSTPLSPLFPASIFLCVPGFRFWRRMRLRMLMCLCVK